MKYLSKNIYWNITGNYNIDKILYLLIDRPDHINNNVGLYMWRNTVEEEHRDYDFPAMVYVDVSSYYCLNWKINDLFHRNNNKPARMWNNGYNEYWINGKHVKTIPSRPGEAP